MDRESLRTELAAGLAATAPYLLSHHERGDPRCHVLAVGERRLRLCARCSGVYPGIVLGVLAWVTGLARTQTPVLTLALVATLPGPALAHWVWLAVTDRTGRNWTRTVTGLLLGVGYALGAGLLLSGDLRVLAVGAGYAIAAALALVRFPDAGWD